MPRRAIYVLALAIGLMAASAPMFAHHGTAAYDLSKTITVKGKVTKFSFINPYCQVFFRRDGRQGRRGALAGGTHQPKSLDPDRWTKETLKPGDDVTITGYRTKDGTNSIWIGKILLKNEELKLSSE